jgi:hypothetical protein
MILVVGTAVKITCFDMLGLEGVLPVSRKDNITPRFHVIAWTIRDIVLSILLFSLITRWMEGSRTKEIPSCTGEFDISVSVNHLKSRCVNYSPLSATSSDPICMRLWIMSEI